MIPKGWLFALLCSLLHFSAIAAGGFDTGIKPADALPEKYMPLLAGKRVALVVNQTSAVGDSLLPEILLHRGITVVKIFVPEHGFRGTADAGAKVDSYIDSATHLPVISLYGKHKQPQDSDLADVDVLVYDLQDVGVRFYTYISTLQYCMEACAENHKELIILDKPDPNGFYVDGPVLEADQKSFVGMQPIPIVYGMTPGEYARMLVGQHWLSNGGPLQLTVVPCTNYDHSKRYRLPVAPSPNLRNMAAVYAYPSLCLFEGTPVSLGRGTDKPFQQFGAPAFKSAYRYGFVPRAVPGASAPLYANDSCYGQIVAASPEDALGEINNRLQLRWLMDAYRHYPADSSFFKPFFDKLAGTSKLKQQIMSGITETDIRNSWQPAIINFRSIRAKYLLYPDFH